MNIHEYQAKQLFASYGISVPKGKIAHSVEEALAAYEEFGGLVAVKAQVHVGGRGKAGGVKIAKSADEVKAAAEAILGMDIKGHTVHKIYIEQGSNIAKEAYVSVLIDRSDKSIGFICSAEGGMDIEEVAASTPEKILLFNTEDYEFPEAKAREVAAQLFGEDTPTDKVVDFLSKIFTLFVEKDCSLVEVNPLVLTAEGDVIALDGKLTADDNGLFKHPDLVELRDMNEEDPNEIEAAEKGLAFIQLDGDIGCMVNGAGLAMATLDMINLCGGKPANFLDVGGSSNPEKVVSAFEYILSSGKVKAILINIFGGITRCDDIAKGILESFERIDINVPVVVRLSGTNAEEGKAMLEGSSLIPASTFSEAVKKTIELAKGNA